MLSYLLLCLILLDDTLLVTLDLIGLRYEHHQVVATLSQLLYLFLCCVMLNLHGHQLLAHQFNLLLETFVNVV